MEETMMEMKRTQIDAPQAPKPAKKRKQIIKFPDPRTGQEREVEVELTRLSTEVPRWLLDELKAIHNTHGEFSWVVRDLLHAYRDAIRNKKLMRPAEIEESVGQAVLRIIQEEQALDRAREAIRKAVSE